MQTKFSKITTELQKELPRWFKMRKSKESTGAQFLNIFGLQFEDVEWYLDYALNNQYIDSADVGQIDVIYKATLPSSLTPESRFLFFAENMKLEKMENLKKFFEGINTKYLQHKEIYYNNPYYIDWERKAIYVKKAYEPAEYYEEGKIHIEVYGTFDEIIFEADLPTQIHHVWNFFDEFGLLLDTPRLYGEKNVDYKERLLDVFRHPANSTYIGLHHHLARELNLWREVNWYDGGADLIIKHGSVVVHSIEVDDTKWAKEYTYYDDSNRLVLKGDPLFDGKLRKVRYIVGLDMHTFHNKKDYAFQDELYSVDRVATPMLKYYVDVITNQVPVMWNQFVWNESFWDVANQEMSGYGYIPNYNDARFTNWLKYKE